jgi:hypothetical protein
VGVCGRKREDKIVYQKIKPCNIMINKVLVCPGLDSFHPGSQYLVSFVCQIGVVKLNFDQNISFNIHFFTLLIVFKAKIYFFVRQRIKTTYPELLKNWKTLIENGPEIRGADTGHKFPEYNV